MGLILQRRSVATSCYPKILCMCSQTYAAGGYRLRMDPNNEDDDSNKKRKGASALVLCRKRLLHTATECNGLLCVRSEGI